MCVSRCAGVGHESQMITAVFQRFLTLMLLLKTEKINTVNDIYYSATTVTKNNHTQTHYEYLSSYEHTIHIIHQYYAPVALHVKAG